MHIKRKGEWKTRMILVNASFYEGTPPRLYRTPEEIKTDINSVKTKILKLNSMLNVRNVIGEMLSERTAEGNYNWLSELRSAVEEAERTLELLSELNDSLDCLAKELEETRCAMRL